MFGCEPGTEFVILKEEFTWSRTLEVSQVMMGRKEHVSSLLVPFEGLGK